MRIVCPACEAEYDVPEAVGGAGRKVRCARCQTVWLASAAPPAPSPPEPEREPAPAPPIAPPAELEPPRPPALFADPPRVRSDWGRADRAHEDDDEAPADAPPGVAPWIAAWVLSLVLLGAAGWAGYHWQADVIRLWPASERLYAVLSPKGP